MNNCETMLNYCEAHSSPVQGFLHFAERNTHLRTLAPQMLAGPYQGMLLQMISHMLRPSLVLEIGTFTGYGAICLAQGLQVGGMLHSIEADDELRPLIQEHIEKAGLAKSIELHFGDAANIVPLLESGFDLVFLDAGKLDYAEHYEMTLPKIRAGGFLLADNVLWHGKVLHDEKDGTAIALRAFNQMVHADPRVEQFMFPLRDGLMLVRKK